MGRIRDFLGLYTKESSVRVYRPAIKRFLVVAYGLKEALSEEAYEELADRYFSEARDHIGDLAKFVTSLGSRPPKTARAYLTPVK